MTGGTRGAGSGAPQRAFCIGQDGATARPLWPHSMRGPPRRCRRRGPKLEELDALPDFVAQCSPFHSTAQSLPSSMSDDLYTFSSWPSAMQV